MEPAENSPEPHVIRAIFWILLVVGTAAAIVSVEVAAWWFVPSTAWTRLFQRLEDPVLVYGLKPGVSMEFEGVAVRIPASRVAISTDGYRASSFHDYPPDRCQAVILGDSIAFGWGVDVADRFPEKLSELTGIPAVSLGVPGYRTDQMVRAYELAAPELRTAAILMTLISNDFDTALVDHFGVLRESFGLVNRLASVRLWNLWRNQRRMDAYSKAHRSEGRLLVVQAVRKLMSSLWGRGIPLVLVTLENSEEIASTIRELSGPGVFHAPVGPDPEKPEYWIPRDWHPGALGHRFMAVRLDELYGPMLESAARQCEDALARSGE